MLAASLGGDRLHTGEGSMDGGAAGLDGDDRVEGPDGSLEGLQVAVLVREHAEVARVNPETDTDMDVLLGGLEPSVPLGLRDNGQECLQ